MGEYPGKLGLTKIAGPTTLNTIFSKHEDAGVGGNQ